MSSTKRKSTDENCGAQWTDTEQNRLSDLFAKGSIGFNDNAAKVKTLDAVFDKYSNNVIGHYLGLLKRKKSSAQKDTGPVKEVLSQLGVVPPPSSLRTESTIDLSDTVDGSSLICENMPFVRFNYMHYESKQEKIVVLVDLPGGSGCFDWHFNERGDKIIIFVEWSRALYDVSNLFKDELESKNVTLNHPKLHSMQNELVRKGMSANQIPKSCIHIPLSKRVQKDDDTWDVIIVKHDGNKIIKFELSCFQEQLLQKAKRGSFE